MKHFMFVACLLALLLSACGTPAPKYDATQVQATFNAAIGTKVAMTLAAMPTITPSPLPTQTPLPSPTVAELSTLLPFTGLSTTVNPTSTQQGGTGSCLHPLDTGQAGPGHATLIKNETTGPINVSLNLYTPNAFGQCGSISYGGIGKNGSALASLPAGYWFIYAWGRSKDDTFTASLSIFVQPAQFLKLEICVRDGKVVYKMAC
jgi:hypothetical protein